MESAQRCCANGARIISANETVGIARRSISNNIPRLMVRGALEQRSTMKLVVLGATGGTGLEVVRQALQRGHSVTALVRSPDRLKPFGGQIAVKQGDLLSSADLQQVIQATMPLCQHSGRGYLCRQRTPICYNNSLAG